jgi:hypothetical protein
MVQVPGVRPSMAILPPSRKFCDSNTTPNGPVPDTCITLIAMLALSGRMDFAPARSDTRDKEPHLCSMSEQESRKIRLIRAIRTKRVKD